ncbi:MAG: stage 0 sporulation protein J [Chloroflexi bacterium]|nr:MAG: stage 0 sporulation protein J [Chloroflexota bacterium]RLC90198.1 MAG: stage 0 sporulation protein J [Chloroflexota bacterium]HEY67519.1 ParB/RepB/Spo0J family partition protein [Thermoflexia bacterium]
MSPRKRGLGKGLEALIPLAEEEAAAQGVVEVPLASITPNPHQPRAPIRDQDLVELAASIEEHGIIQPLVVTRAPDGYQLIAGERRWRAARLAGLPTVPVIVKDVAPSEMLELALVENLQRADLNPLEEAMAYRQLTEEFGLTQEQVARRVGKSRVAVSNTLRLLKAARPVQEALLAGKISEGHARALLGLERAEAQEAALKAVLRRGLNVRQTEELVRRLLGLREEQRPAHAPSPETRALESRFREALGTKVSLTRSGEGGRIVIYFYSEEELNALYERIVGSGE